MKKTMKKMRITSVRNAYGVKVKKCCASCLHKCVDNDGTRICEKLELKVEQRFKCKQWEMADGLKNVRRRQGKIKRLEYLLFVQDVRTEEQEAIDNGNMIPEEMSTLDSIRKRFEEETGLSPFIIL